MVTVAEPVTPSESVTEAVNTCVVYPAVSMRDAVSLVARKPSRFDVQVTIRPESKSSVTVAKAGISFGCNAPVGDEFCPDDLVSRAQIASFLDRALGLTNTGTDFFVDDDGSVHEASINRIAADASTIGCYAPDPSLFCSTASVTRAQMASFLGRALDLEEIFP